MKLNKKQTRLLIKSLCKISRPFIKQFVNKDGELVITEKRLELGWKRFPAFRKEQMKIQISTSLESAYAIERFDLAMFKSYPPLVHYRAFIEHTIEIVKTNTFEGYYYSACGFPYDRYDPTSFKRMTKRFLEDLTKPNLQ